MNPFAVFFLVVASVAVLMLPRKWAPLPLLAGICYMTLGQGLEFGPFRFPIIRLILLAGFIRVLFRGDWRGTRLVGLDKLMLVWAAWFALASAFHNDPSGTLTTHSGHIYNALGAYFLFRCFCQNDEDLVAIVGMVAIILVPVAVEMCFEHLLTRNLFAVFGGVDEIPTIRSGKLRSQGPFGHAILAGTVGAGCAPLFLGIFRSNPRLAKVGLVASVVMVITSSSSGPIVSLAVGMAAVALWSKRHLVPNIRIVFVLGYIVLDLVMPRPAYYLMAYVDLTGSSTGYHRARIIESAFEHLDEWWFAGTDYTRHWMAYGVSWSEDHADITNQYLGQGVKGGLLLMFLFIALLWCAFRYIHQILTLPPQYATQQPFLIWSIGAALFAHAVTFFSVAYFDQSFLFVYLELAMIASIWAAHINPSRVADDRVNAEAIPIDGHAPAPVQFS